MGFQKAESELVSAASSEVGAPLIEADIQYALKYYGNDRTIKAAEQEVLKFDTLALAKDPIVSLRASYQGQFD